MTRASRRHHRGFAMMLVLVSLLTATILATAYLASRDNSTAIGANVTMAAEARWAALTGLDLGVAVLQTDEDWQTEHVNGVLFENYDIDGVDVDLSISDIETGDPPSADTDHVVLTATAECDGIVQTATAYASIIPGSDSDSVNVDLSEFAVFAADTISLNGDSTITRWPNSPTSVQGRKVSIGTQASGAGAIAINDNAAMLDTVLYAPSTASVSLVTGDVNSKPTQDVIPLPDAPDHEQDAPGGSPSLPAAITGGTSVMNGGSRVQSLTVTGVSLLTITPSAPSMTLIIDEDLTVSNNGRIGIGGDVKVVVFGDLIMDNGSIDTHDGSSVEIYVLGDVLLSDAYLGPNRGASLDRDNSGDLAVGDPRQLAVYGDKSAPQTWIFKDNSVIVGSFYAPRADVRIEGDSALYGRVACDGLAMYDNGTIYFDHRFDNGFGYTNEACPIYDNDGGINDACLTLDSLDASDISVAEGDLGVTMIATSKRRGSTTTGGAATFSSPAPLIPTPTDRPNTVVFTIVTYGQDTDAWENSQ